MRNSWNDYYEILQELYKETGSINVPIKFEYRNITIGRWLARQRNRYNKKILGVDKIRLLEALHIEWNLNVIIKNNLDAYWNNCFELAKKYYEEHGNLIIPVKYAVEGVNLGVWLRGQRSAYRGNNRRKISAEQIRKLESIGIV